MHRLAGSLAIPGEGSPGPIYAMVSPYRAVLRFSVFLLSFFLLDAWFCERYGPPLTVCFCFAEIALCLSLLLSLFLPFSLSSWPKKKEKRESLAMSPTSTPMA